MKIIIVIIADRNWIGAKQMTDEKKLIDELHEIRKTYDTKHADKFDKGVVAGIDTAIHLLVTADKSGKWIPVGERLPEPSLNSVIGWDAYRERCVFVQYYMNDWILGNHESVKIVAWMPLPEPYVEGEDEE